MDKEKLHKAHCMLSALVLLNYSFRHNASEFSQLSTLADTIRCGYRLARLVRVTEDALKRIWCDDLEQIDIMQRQAAAILKTAHDEKSQDLLTDDIEELAQSCLRLFMPEASEKNGAH